jgi:hypothetical protein
MIDFDGTRLWIRTNKKGKRVYIGKIGRGVLYVQDKHNYDRVTNSIGLDTAILRAEFLRYEIIFFRRPEGVIVVNREWLWRNGREMNIDNGRQMIFVEREKIDIKRQIEYEKELANQIQYKFRF